jgi:RNA polymerase sigma-70 factor, ECF subfamily
MEVRAQKSAGGSEDFSKALIAAIPGLRAFGISLTSNTDRADDLVQETMLKAWKSFESFEPGSNLRAWLYTILRNEFYTQLRKRKREVEDADGVFAAKLSVPGGQESHLDMEDMRAALSQLPPDQREAIILVGASGFSYEEAAEICVVAVGTIKSRVSRARTRLAELLLPPEDVAAKRPATSEAA